MGRGRGVDLELLVSDGEGGFRDIGGIALDPIDLEDISGHQRQIKMLEKFVVAYKKALKNYVQFLAFDINT